MSDYTLHTDIIMLLKNGHPKAARMLYDSYAPVLSGIVHKIVSDPIQAGQILSDYFADLYTEIHSFDEKKISFQDWLNAMCRKKAIRVKANLPGYDKSDDINKLKKLNLEKDDATLRKHILEMVYCGSFTPGEIATLINQHETYVLKEIGMALKQYRK